MVIKKQIMKEIYMLRGNILLLSLMISLSISCQNSTDSSKKNTQIIKSEEEQKVKEVSILFMGDFMQHGPQIRAAKDSNGDYTVVLYLVS